MSRQAFRIVVCDDSATYGRALTEFLEYDPGIHVVEVFRSAEEMLAALRHIDPDLITMDLEMPGMGGTSAIDQIMRERPVPILVLSAYAGKGSDRAAAALTAGALEAMDKSSLHLLEPSDVWATAQRSRIKRLASLQLKARSRGGRVAAVPPQPRGPARIARA
ncbi:MAG: response regulator, partial [Actinomycetota bacterium]|nr:response regulator [Actinomycetota bacterium]